MGKDGGFSNSRLVSGLQPASTKAPPTTISKSHRPSSGVLPQGHTPGPGPGGQQNSRSFAAALRNLAKQAGPAPQEEEPRASPKNRAPPPLVRGPSPAKVSNRSLDALVRIRIAWPLSCLETEQSFLSVSFGSYTLKKWQKSVGVTHERGKRTTRQGLTNEQMCILGTIYAREKTGGDTVVVHERKTRGYQ